jgi:protocadherin Fat 1/2/3
VDGKLWFQLDCGSGPGILGISGRTVNDGSWHSVFLELNRNFTSLALDDSYVERRRAPLYFQTLSAESTIYFGALVQADDVGGLADTRVTQVLSGFQGCLESVVLNNELPLHNKRSSFAEVVGLTELKLGCVLYPDACQRSPCLHGGSCTGLPSGGECSWGLRGTEGGKGTHLPCGDPGGSHGRNPPGALLLGALTLKMHAQV